MLSSLKVKLVLLAGTMVGALTITLSLNVIAAPGELSTKPLFLGSTVQPNILFLVDDSGSMDWEVLKSEGAEDAYSNQGSFPNSGDLDITPDSRAEYLESCAGYNVLYYNPNVTYTPWVGVDEDGNAYQDQQITSARRNPYDPDEGTRDLTSRSSRNGAMPGYFVWTDTNNNDVFDQGECPDSNDSSFNFNSQFTATISGFGPTGMSSTEQTNFANWYTYYRKREYIVKRALSEIITDGQTRMGLATLWNNDSVGTIVEDVDDITTPVDTQAQSNKLALLDNLFDIRSSGGTPLRQTLEEAGEYFQVGVSPGSGLFGFTPNPSSPILSEDEGGACQQNFSILLSDGFWNGSSPSVGNADQDSASNPSEFDGGSYADDFSNTLADVAMTFYETDLAPALEDIVPVTAGVDNNTAQHMVSFMVAFGVNGTLSEDPPNTTDAFNWPQPSSGRNTTIDDMRHAAWNGRGEFLSAKDPQALIDSLSESIASIQNRTGSATSVAFNTTSVSEGTFVFLASFDSGIWSGTLQALEFDDDGVGLLQWDAAQLMNDDGFRWQDRNIFTYRSDLDRGIPFVFPPDYHTRIGTTIDDNYLNESQIRDVLANAPFSITSTDTDDRSGNQVFGELVVDYLYGDFSGEGVNSFRVRHGSRLGDIVHSNPEYVGVPSEQYPNAIEGSDNLYSTYISEKADRRGVVYVGANDGMLHAFDADTGEELFAYIPNLVFDDGDTGLHRLTETDYTHTPYVDGSLVSRDVFINGDWETYLVGSLRAGGKGVFVLDVSDPSTYLTMNDVTSAQLAVTEFTHNDMGYSFSTPQIARMNNGKWAAIFGNGYNNDPNGDGTAKLFILYLDGSGVEVLETEVGSVSGADCLDSGSDCNGLSSPSLIDLDGNFTVDRIYAGDLHGNMWSFNVYSESPTDWSASYGSSATPQPLFTACSSTPCSASNRQPITTKPMAIGHPSISNASTHPNVLVMFGTGQYIAENDNFDTSQQSFYGIWDAGGSNFSLERDVLVAQTISNVASVDGARTLSANAVSYNPATPIMGWHIDFIAAGERVAVDPLVVGDYVFFVTTVPETDECSAGGTGFVMAADIRTGGQPTRQIFTRVDDGTNAVALDGAFAGFELGAVPGGGTVIDGDTLVVADSLGRVVSTDLNTANPNKNTRRASWSIVK